ncbi:hypothetical protein RCO48_38205 [Peribacillus frigoritolerans]|nr:hypothetical protein [Peribacillus frigoritolerans]MDQ7864837.1 hypothetical protein [Peribacillus frigoritolerans]
MERKVRDSCGKSVAKGDPAGERRGGSRTARGKRVPGVEIITHTPFRKSAPFPPTVCQASSKQAPVRSRVASISAVT